MNTEAKFFDFSRHAREYQYDYATVVDGIMHKTMCATLRDRINRVIDA